MSRTPDRRAGRLEEEAILFDDRTVDGNPTDEREIRYVSGAFKGKDAAGVFDLRVAGGISAAAHLTLRQLIHFIDDGPAKGFLSGAFREILPAAAVFPTSVIWYESVAKAKKIVEKVVTYTGAFPTTIVWKVYDTDGSTVLETVTDTIVYSGAFETTRTRAIA